MRMDEGAITCLAFNPQLYALASGNSMSKSVRYWGLEEFRLVSCDG